MKTDTRDLKPHVYTLVVRPPIGDDVTFWSKQPFGAFTRGDMVRSTTISPLPGPAYLVDRVEREVHADADEILDTTWVFLATRRN